MHGRGQIIAVYGTKTKIISHFPNKLQLIHNFQSPKMLTEATEFIEIEDRNLFGLSYN